MSKRKTIKVPVTFSGVVSVLVPADTKLDLRLAQIIALAHLKDATLLGTNTTMADALDSYCEDLGVSKLNRKALLNATLNFGRTTISSVRGVWAGKAIPNAKGLFPGDIGFRKGPVVEATLTDDTHYLDSVVFDASLWFEQASDAELERFAEEDWGGGYEADNVAEFFTGKCANPKIVKFFEDKRAGFEVYINEKLARAWLGKHRPHLHV